jgi:NAD+ kinase
MEIKRVIVITNRSKDPDHKFTKDVSDILTRFGCEAVQTENAKDINAINRADLIICLGGDGTIMNSAHTAALMEIPIMGVNLGRIGYIAELEPDEISMIERLFAGDFTIENRMMLSAGKAAYAQSLDSGDGTAHVCALNDVVVTNAAVSRIADFELRCGGNIVNRYRADGIIIATPTGSTAYSMSAGGPVIDPNLDCICATPICSHSLSTKPLIFSGNTELEIINNSRDKSDMCVTLDGGESFAIGHEESVFITKSKITTKLIRLKKDGFFNILSKKMSE